MTRTLLPLAALAAFLTAAGCADALTFSKTERAQGRIALSEGDHESATLIFRNQVRRAPKDYKAHFHLGEARWAAGRYPEALQSYRAALDVMALSPSGRSDDEYRTLIVEEYARALAEVDADGSLVASIEDNSTGDVWKKLLAAQAHAKAGRPDAAIAAFRAARGLDRDNAHVAKAYGLYLESIRQDAAAEEVLRRAYALAPQDAQVAAALVRLGVVPGPAILSKNALARPAVPLGPLPEIDLSKPQPADAPDNAAARLN